MRVVEIIDLVLPPPHPNREGLSYGQLVLLFLTYVLHMRTHRLSSMVEWVANHRWGFFRATGWAIHPKEATDDRLGDLLMVLGSDEKRGYDLQRELGHHLIKAYALPSNVARYDTTTFSVYHVPQEDGTAAGGVLAKGHSKDKRPDLLQFKQSLGTLDPAGVPLLTETLDGQVADLPLYLPAWQRMTETIGHTQFLFVADCKAAALETRALIHHKAGKYLFPLPMTGKVPEILEQQVKNPPIAPEPIALAEPPAENGAPRVVGRGFEIEKPVTATLPNGQKQMWTERWLFTQSDALSQREQKTWQKRLQRVETQLTKLKPKAEENADALTVRAQEIVKRCKMMDIITIQVHETVTPEKRYIGRGRPGPNRPFQLLEVRHLHLTFERNQSALAQVLTLAGWLLYVTNVSVERLSLSRAIDYYRDQWLVERGYHRFKGGSLPALPL